MSRQQSNRPNTNYTNEEYDYIKKQADSIGMKYGQYIRFVTLYSYYEEEYNSIIERVKSSKQALKKIRQLKVKSTFKKIHPPKT